MNNISVPRALLVDLMDMAKDHVNDIETGLEDGTYEKFANSDLDRKKAAIEAGDKLVAIPEPVSTIDVAHFGLYGQPEIDEPLRMTHRMDISDQRVSNGQVYVDIGLAEGDLDEVICTIHEINADPLNGLNQVACVHLSPMDTDYCISIFLMADNMVMRLDDSVALEPVDGRNDLYWLK